MKIYGVSMVRDEADIVAVTVRHHLALGLDKVIVIDNGSRDRTPAVLEGLRREPRFSWRRIETDGHRQAELFTALAREAHADGADWLMPFDADEFWDAGGECLRDVLADSAAGVLRTRHVNFVQARDCGEASARSLATMDHRARPHGRGHALNQELVESGETAWVAAHSYPKAVTRLCAGTSIAMGNHSALTTAGATHATSVLRVLHAPLRSRDSLRHKAENGRRVSRVYSDPEIGWHSKRFARLELEGRLEQEWQANSQRDGVLDLPNATCRVVRDQALVRAVGNWL
jgi:hypothetical protein